VSLTVSAAVGGSAIGRGLVVVALIFIGGSHIASGIVGSTNAALALTATGAVVRRVAVHPRVDGATVLGALCIYLLIGTFFAALFWAIAAFSGEPFFGGQEPRGCRRRLTLGMSPYVTLMVVLPGW
jgi:hypothetical protein